MMRSHGSRLGWLSVAILFLLTGVKSVIVDFKNENGLKTAVYLSPKIVLSPGKVSNIDYPNIDFPRGHIAIKNFYSELVDEFGKSVPLHETYIHHWVTARSYHRDGIEDIQQADSIPIRNSGICEDGLTHYFGLGAETRKSVMYIPDPYAIEVGNPLDIPSGYVEQWLLNVHAMDLRGTEDKIGCTECICDLYNVTMGEYGQPLPLGYGGGLLCCYNGRTCKLKQGFHGVERSLFLKYSVEYVDWVDTIVPVKIYIIDVTDTWRALNESSKHLCNVEYNVEASSAKVDNYGSIDTQKVVVDFPINGDVLYGVGHQHAAGLGMTLYGEDGRTICSSIPIYGEGEEAGNEAGFIVGMSGCYHQPGSVKISKRELLTLDSKYSSNKEHTGVMGFFYLLVADSTHEPHTVLHASVVQQQQEIVEIPLLIAGVIGVALLVIVGVIVIYQRRSGRDDGYETIMM